jgi:sialic acid synthase SpsE
MILMGKEIDYYKPPFFIAELSQNYDSLEEAYRLMQACKDAGADAIKIQALDPNELTFPGSPLFDLYKYNISDLPDLCELGRRLDIPVFASVFGFHSLDVLETLDCPAYKISSFENNWRELIQACRDTEKPLLISMGLYPEDFHGFPRADVVMHCVSAYPTQLVHANLGRITQLAKSHPHVGYSDHTIGSRAAEYAVALGARVIEKHVSLRYTTIDGAFSATPESFGVMVRNCNQAFSATATYCVGVEDECMQYKRSIYITENIKAGEKFTEANVKVLRPNGGLNTSHYATVLGMEASRDLESGNPLTQRGHKRCSRELSLISYS